MFHIQQQGRLVRLFHIIHPHLRGRLVTLFPLSCVSSSLGSAQHPHPNHPPSFTLKFHLRCRCPPSVGSHLPDYNPHLNPQYLPHPHPCKSYQLPRSRAVTLCILSRLPLLLNLTTLSVIYIININIHIININIITRPSSQCILHVFPLSSFRRFPFTCSSFFLQVRHRAGAFLLSRDRLRPQIPPPKGHCLQASRAVASSRLILLCFSGT